MKRMPILFFLLSLLVMSAPSPSASQMPQPQKPDDKPTFKVLGTFTNRYKIANKYILVAPKLSDDELIKLAKKLHHKEPDVTFWFLDDDSQFSQLLKSLKEIEAGNTGSFPQAWAKQHIIANLQPWYASGRGTYWVLCKGDGIDKIVEIE